MFINITHIDTSTHRQHKYNDILFSRQQISLQIVYMHAHVLSSVTEEKKVKGSKKKIERKSKMEWCFCHHTCIHNKCEQQKDLRKAHKHVDLCVCAFAKAILFLRDSVLLSVGRTLAFQCDRTKIRP